MIMKKYLHPTQPDREMFGDMAGDSETGLNPDFENARLIGYFRIARLKFLTFSCLFGIGVIVLGLMYLFQSSATFGVFSLLKILMLLMMGCLAHLCWRAMLVVEKALIQHQGNAPSKVRHAICFCHLSTFLVSFLVSVGVYDWLSSKSLTLWALFIAPTVFVGLFKLLMIEHTPRILKWFDSTPGLTVYPLPKRQSLTPQSRRIVTTIYIFFAFTYLLVGIVLYSLL